MSVPIPRGTLKSFDYGEAGGGEREQALAIFIDGEKVAVKAVCVGAEHGEGFGKIDAQAQAAAVGIVNVDTTVNSGGGGRGGRRAVEKRFIERRAGRMEGDAGNSNAIGNGFEFCGNGRRGEGEIGGADFGGVVGTNGKHRAGGGRATVDIIAPKIREGMTLFDCCWTV